MSDSAETAPRLSLDPRESELIDVEVDVLPHLPPTPVRSRFGVLLLGASIILIALNLRLAVTSIGPVLPHIIRSMGLSPFGAGVLTTLPLLCFGLFGPVAPQLSRRAGTERAVLLGLVMMAGGTLMRGWASASGLFAGQMLACLGISVINVLLPGLVKRDFPHRVGMLTGLYVMALSIGGALAAGTTVPLQDVFAGSWTKALAVWATPTALTAVIWMTQVPPRGANAGHVGFVVRGLWTDRLAWQLTIFMAMQSAMAYIVFGWLVVILQGRGLDAMHAGLVLSACVLAQALGALLSPSIGTLRGDQRIGNAVGALMCLTGLMGCIYAPLFSVWVWATMLGFATGGIFALGLTMIVFRSPDAHVAAHLSSMAQTVGYLTASGGPLLAGMLHGWLGGWNAVALLYLALSVGAALFGVVAGRPHLVGARSFAVQ